MGTGLASLAGRSQGYAASGKVRPEQRLRQKD